jgi:multicomponent Na+:H+ antiporter subunit F
MTPLLIAMVVALLIPMSVAWRRTDVWERLTAFASASTKVAVIMLAVSVLRDDWMIGLVGVLVLSVGNASLLLLAHLLQGLQR